MPRSRLLDELLDRGISLQGAVPLAAEPEATTPLTPLTPEQKAENLIRERQAAYENYRKSGEDNLLKRSEARRTAEEQKNLGRTIATLLSGALMKDNAGERVGIVGLPTIAEVSKGDLLRQALDQKDVEDHHVALKSYYDNSIKAQDYLKSIELERMKQEGLSDRDKPFDTSRMIQDKQGYYFVPRLNKETGKVDFEPTGIQGQLRDKNDANNRFYQNEKDEAQKEKQKIQKLYGENNETLQRLKGLDDKKDEDESEIRSIVAGYKEGKPSWGYIKTKAQLIEALKKEQVEHEKNYKYWQAKAGDNVTKGWYERQAEDSAKDPLGLKKKKGI